MPLVDVTVGCGAGAAVVAAEFEDDRENGSYLTIVSSPSGPLTRPGPSGISLISVYSKLSPPAHPVRRNPARPAASTMASGDLLGPMTGIVLVRFIWFPIRT